MDPLGHKEFSVRGAVHGIFPRFSGFGFHRKTRAHKKPKRYRQSKQIECLYSIFVVFYLTHYIFSKNVPTSFFASTTTRPRRHPGPGRHAKAYKNVVPSHWWGGYDDKDAPQRFLPLRQPMRFRRFIQPRSRLLQWRPPPQHWQFVAFWWWLFIPYGDCNYVRRQSHVLA